GVVDLIAMKAMRFEGENGENIVIGDIPADLVADAESAREEMLDGLSMFSDDLTEAMLEEKVSEELIHRALREATLAQQVVPVMMGSAYQKKGVQHVLDAVGNILPTPADIQSKAVDPANDEAEVLLSSSPDQPLVMLAFKLEDGRFGQLTYLRVYQGKLVK